jgi:hypothetical protein
LKLNWKILTVFAMLLLCLSIVSTQHVKAQSGSCEATDSWANMCASTAAGTFFEANDGPTHAVYANGFWRAFFNDYPITPLVANAAFPTAPTFSWVNQGSATRQNLGGCIYEEAPLHSSTYGNLNILAASAPSAPWKWTVPMNVNLTGNVNDVGIAVGNSTNNKWVTVSLKQGSIWVFHETSPTLWHDTAMSAYFSYTYPLIFQIENDGTNLHFRWSNDGFKFVEMWSETNTYFLGTIGSPDLNGLYVDSQDGRFATGATFCGMNYN